MRKISKQKIKIKNLIGLVDNPVEEDLLFEIISFLEKENRFDEDFTKTEVSLKTRCRLGENLEEDLFKLINKGYIEKSSKTRYKVLDHIW